MIFHFRGKTGNERGTALILALCALMVMSILGAMVLSSATTEIGISANFRGEQHAFSAADRAIEYAMTDEVIYKTATPAAPLLDLTVDTTATATIVSNIAAESGHSGLQAGAVNSVNYLTSGPLPPGSGSDPTIFQSRYYALDMTGAGPNNSTARIESQVARVVPK